MAIWLLRCIGTKAAFDIGHVDDSDLTRFVTRPEIKAPILNITVHDSAKTAAGYLFIAPYAHILQEAHARNYYQPCQTGPHIYDLTGSLVWSGACMFGNQNACDFRAWMFDDTNYLSAILTTYIGTSDSKGHGIILDSSYNITKPVYAPPDSTAFDMHEFILLGNGKTAVHLLQKPRNEKALLPAGDARSGWYMDNGFREVDIATGDTIFEWWAGHDGRLGTFESRAVRTDAGRLYGQVDWL